MGQCLVNAIYEIEAPEFQVKKRTVLRKMEYSTFFIIGSVEIC